MTTKLSFGRDVQGYNSFAPAPSTDMFSASIPSGASASITVPSNFQNWIASFSFQPGSDVWVSYTGTATPPAGATFASTASELLPGSRALLKATVVSFYNNGTDTADVGAILYAVS